MTQGVWVFGYGSLTWHPGFEYEEAVVGRIEGYARKFWQGNTTHRGTAGKPGRVATLIKDKDGVVWGRAFLVKCQSALPYLDTRECRLGGYVTTTTAFQPMDTSLEPFQALLYLATPTNDHWLGEASETEIAAQILASIGPTGHNVEYLLRLADFMRAEVPDAEDDHLFALEELVRRSIRERNIPIGRFMRAPTNRRVARPQQPANRMPSCSPAESPLRNYAASESNLCAKYLINCSFKDFNSSPGINAESTFYF